MDINYKKSTLLYCIIAIVVGLLLLIIPKYCIYGIVILLGIFSIVNGVYNLVKIRNIITDPDFYIVLTIRGIVSIVIGILAVLLPAIFAKTATAIWTVMVYILAVYLLVTAIMELYATVQIKKFGLETKPYITEILFSLAAGILLFFIPPKTFGEIILRIIGAGVVVIGVTLMIIMFKNKPIVVYAEEVPSDPNENMNDAAQPEDDVIAEVEAKEVPEEKTETSEKAEKKPQAKKSRAKKSSSENDA